MLPLYIAHQGLGLQEARGRRCTPPEQLISLRPGASIVCRAVSSVEVLNEMKDVPASEDFIRPHLRKLAAYTPIEPFEVLSKRLGRDAMDIVKLDANENPYGPPPEVLQALGSMPFPNIYPDPETRRLRAALAEANNIPMEHLLVRCLSAWDTYYAAKAKALTSSTLHAITFLLNPCSILCTGGLRGRRAHRSAHEVCTGSWRPHCGLPTNLHNVRL